MPDWVPNQREVVYATGVAEFAGGLGVLIPSQRKRAGRWLIALLIGVFPANVEMVTNYEKFRKTGIPLWVLWARLPLQPLAILWTARATQR